MLAIVVACSAVVGLPATPAAAYEESTIVALANQSRAAQGLRGLVRNTSLDHVALGWANQMALNGFISHNPSYTSEIPGGWTSAGENVAQGYGSASALHEGWMNSTGHRANILGDFTDIGTALIRANGTTWAVQVFAKYPGSEPQAPAGHPSVARIGTGAVSIKGPSSELLPGVTVEIRSESCDGEPVWNTTTTSRPDAYGAFGIGLAPGRYCIKTLSAPPPYSVAPDVVFTIEPRHENWVTVWLPGPTLKRIVTGALVTKSVRDRPVNGVTAHIREGSCVISGQGVWQNTTAANQWAQGGFGISLAEGLYCVSTLGVPLGYETPQPFEVTVASPSPYWITIWVPGRGPS